VPEYSIYRTQIITAKACMTVCFYREVSVISGNYLYIGLLLWLSVYSGEQHGIVNRKLINFSLDRIYCDITPENLNSSLLGNGSVNRFPQK
jgi:hypothetical protein